MLYSEVGVSLLHEGREKYRLALKKNSAINLVKTVIKSKLKRLIILRQNPCPGYWLSYKIIPLFREF
jgi:hypothetical protein